MHSRNKISSYSQERCVHLLRSSCKLPVVCVRIQGEIFTGGHIQMIRKKLWRFPLLLALAVFQLTAIVPAQQPTTSGLELSGILHYISDGWNTLTRSTAQCASVADPKLKSATVVYLPADYPTPSSLQALQGKCVVSIEHLPKPIHNLGEIDVR